MFHYASIHESLKGIIPNKEELELKPEETKSNLTKGKKARSKKVLGTGVQCFMCEFKTNKDNQLKMLQHIAYTHYRDDLHGLFGGSTDKCTRCGLLFTLESQLLAHYISKHQALQDLIPELGFKTP